MFNINAFNLDEFYQLCYNVEYPLTIIFNDGEQDSNLVQYNLNYRSMEDYNKIYFFLIKLRRINDILKFIWEYTNSSEMRRSPPELYSKIRRVQLLRTKMQQFVTNLSQYIFSEIFDKLFTKFMQSLLNKVTRLEEVLLLQKDFLKAWLSRWFLSTSRNTSSNKPDIIRTLYSLTQDLYKACMGYWSDEEIVEINKNISIVIDKVNKFIN